MELAGLLNFAEQFFGQPVAAGESSKSGAKPHRVRGDNDGDRDVRPDDRFTPSANNGAAQAAQDAGLFSVSRVQIFSASADFLMAQAGAAQPSQAPATTANTAAAQSAPVAAASLATTDTPSIPVAAASASATGDTKAQDPLQQMNQALTALGLSQQDIQAVDQIANVIKAFNPIAFSDLVNQLVTLSKQFGQGISTPAATPTDNPQTAPAGGGFQLQELVIRFSGVEAQGTSGAANGSSQGGGNSFQVSAFSLQVEEVKLTLTDNSGQAVQVQAPQQPPNPPVNNPTAQTTAA